MQALAAELRRSDPDRYLSTLYAPERFRAGLTALYAFNAEIARIRDRIREPGLGEIRLQWWSDLLDDIGEMKNTGHPVAVAMGEAIDRHHLPVVALRNLIEARRFDLYDDPMPTVTDLEGYCGETAGALIQLAGLILAPAAAARHADAAGHAGCAQAIAGLLSLLPRHRARRQCYIPGNVLAAAGATAEDLFVPEPGAAAQTALAAMIALAREHLTSFERLAGEIPSALLPGFLPAGLVRPWLDRLQKAGPQAFQHSIELSPVRRQVAMARRALLGWPKRK